MSGCERLLSVNLTGGGGCRLCGLCGCSYHTLSRFWLSRPLPRSLRSPALAFLCHSTPAPCLTVASWAGFGSRVVAVGDYGTTTTNAVWAPLQLPPALFAPDDSSGMVSCPFTCQWLWFGTLRPYCDSRQTLPCRRAIDAEESLLATTLLEETSSSVLKDDSLDGVSVSFFPGNLRLAFK